MSERAPGENQARGKEFPDFVDQVTEFIVRAAELILLAGAFGYAAAKSGSIPAGIVAVVHIGGRASYYFGYWVGGRHPRRYWAIGVVFVITSLGGGVIAAAVKALYEVIVANAG